MENNFEISMIHSLTELGCITLNSLFAMNPAELCPRNGNVRELWSMSRKLLLYGWSADVIPTRIQEPYGLLNIRKDNTDKFEIKIDIDEKANIRSEIKHKFEDNQTHYACRAVYYPLDECHCHIGWAKKLYITMTTFNITRLPLPNH